jgi:hypothetical protein
MSLSCRRRRRASLSHVREHLLSSCIDDLFEVMCATFVTVSGPFCFHARLCVFIFVQRLSIFKVTCAVFVRRRSPFAVIANTCCLLHITRSSASRILIPRSPVTCAISLPVIISRASLYMRVVLSPSIARSSASRVLIFCSSVTCTASSQLRFLMQRLWQVYWKIYGIVVDISCLLFF